MLRIRPGCRVDTERVKIVEYDDADASLPSEDATPEEFCSSGLPRSAFSAEVVDHTLNLLGLIEDPRSEYRLLHQWDATGEPVRFDGALRLA